MRFYVKVSEATALDLIRYGLDRVMTVLQELGESMDADKLIDAVRAEGNMVCAQRLGWLMEKSGYAPLVLNLASFIADRNPPFTRLDPSLPAADSERDTRAGGS